MLCEKATRLRLILCQWLIELSNIESRLGQNDSSIFPAARRFFDIDARWNEPVRPGACRAGVIFVVDTTRLNSASSKFAMALPRRSGLKLAHLKWERVETEAELVKHEAKGGPGTQGGRDGSNLDVCSSPKAAVGCRIYEYAAYTPARPLFAVPELFDGERVDCRCRPAPSAAKET